MSSEKDKVESSVASDGSPVMGVGGSIGEAMCLSRMGVDLGNEVYYGESPRQPEPKLSGLFAAAGMRVTEQFAETSDGARTRVLVFQDATIVSPRKLDTAELNSLGLVPGSDWWPLESGTVFSQCFEEFASPNSSSKFP